MPTIPQDDMGQQPAAYAEGDGGENFNKLIQSTVGNVNEYGGVTKAVGHYGDYNNQYMNGGHHGNYGNSGNRTFENHSTNVSVRSEYNRGDYDHFRPNERTPESFTGLMSASNSAYEHVSVVRSVIDMMGDFTVQGIRIVHPNKKIENFHKNWWNTVQGASKSERAANMLYRLGQAPMKIKMGRVPVGIETDWKKAHARKNDVKLQELKTDHRTIPLGYTLLNPATMAVIGGDLATFVGKPYYGIQIGQHFKNNYRKMEQRAMNDPKLNDMIKTIPEEVHTAIKGQHTVIPLDQSKLEILFYKKDDWNPWAVPMLGSILSNLGMLEKMHLADISALDGAISQIRLWKLGIYNESNPAQSILPARAAIAKLRAILSQVGNGVLDLVWGPELDFKESNSQVHNYLKPEKYEQVMAEIYAGLGVPSSLTGGASKGGQKGFSNNAISMKTMVERLEYGRRVIVAFWNKQLKIIQKTMGWRYPAKIVFDYRVLTDEAAAKTLLINLWEHNIVATETVQELCDRDPELEELRINRERRKMENGSMVQKAGPYHVSEQNQVHDYKKLVLQSGGVTPSEIGLELEERKEGEQTTVEVQQEGQEKVAKLNNDAKIAQQKAKPVGVSGQGRPKNSTDSAPRKQRTPKPKTMGSEFFNRFLWGVKAQKEVADILTPFLLDHFSKDSLRSLTKVEVAEAEKLKLGIFSKMEPYVDITNDLVYKILESPNYGVGEDIINSLRSLSIVFIEKNDREPTLDEMRQMQSSAYSLSFESEEE